MVIAIIQARMGSSRLPKKVLIDIEGTPSLKFMIDRVKKSQLIDKIIIATTTNKEDDEIVEFCCNNDILYHRGSENDVLDRYYQSAKKYQANTIVRLTSDCPLIDPKLIDQTINLFKQKNVDYASNTVPPDKKKYPDGSDVEVFSFEALKKSWTETEDHKDREHVTFYLWKRGQGFKTIMLDNKYDWGKYRITIDYKEDVDLVREIVRKLNNKNLFGSTKEIIEIIEDNEELFRINSMHTWGANW
jgi:spore coat polysaccharide biosynthesis protein SpsF